MSKALRRAEAAILISKFLEDGGVIQRIKTGAMREPGGGLGTIIADSGAAARRQRTFEIAASHEPYVDDLIPLVPAESWELVGSRGNRLRTFNDGDHDDFSAESFS